MHVSSTLLDRGACRRPGDDNRRADRAQRAPQPALQAYRRRRRHLLAALLRRRRGRGGGGGLRNRGEARRGRLSGQRQEDLRLAVGRRDYYGVLCTERARARGPAAATRSISPSPPTPRASPWWATGTRWACAARSRARSSSRTCSCRGGYADAARVYFRAATSWPHMFLTLSRPIWGSPRQPTISPWPTCAASCPAHPPSSGACTRPSRLPWPRCASCWSRPRRWGSRPSARRAPTHQGAGAAAYAAQHTVMENANALAAKAIRTCGGRPCSRPGAGAHLPRQPLRSLMLPWTAEICLDRLGRESLYEAGEKDE